MEKKYRIGLAVFCIVITGVLTFAYCRQEQYKNENKQAAKNEMIVTQVTQGNVEADDTFYLAELNGYLVVYCSDRKTIYEYTNILVEELPIAVQNEIAEWKSMKGIERVYGFLENYSS